MKKNLLLAILAAATLAISACSTFNHLNTPPNIPEGQNETIGTPEQPISTIQKEEKYLKADRNPPKVKELKKQCIQTNGQETCGYDCKVVGHEAKCAQQPKARCVIGPNHEIACGFDCKVTSSQAACGQYLYSNCATNAAGEVKCGNNCQERDDGQLVCGK